VETRRPVEARNVEARDFELAAANWLSMIMA